MYWGGNEESVFPTLWMHLGPSDILPEEKDCGQPQIHTPYKHLTLPGYGIDEALLDRPIKSPMDVFGWIQWIGAIWHDRLIYLSDMNNSPLEEGSKAKYQTCLDAFIKETHMIVTVPPASLFSHVDGIYIPKDVVEHILDASKTHPKRTVCIVALQFEYDEEEETEYLQILHVGSTTASKFSAKWIQRSLVPGWDETDDSCIPRCHCPGIEHAWTLGKKAQLGKFSTPKTHWLFLSSVKTPPPTPLISKKNKVRARAIEMYFGREILNVSSALEPYRAFREDHVPAMFSPHKDEALSYAQALGLMVFSYDFFNGFRKKFLVCSYPAAFRMAFRKDVSCHPVADEDFGEIGWECMYEGMIRQYPQKLILDLEYMKEDNPQWTHYPEDADRITLKIIKFIGEMLGCFVSDGWIPELKDWLILEADSEKKMSRHAILNAPGKYFHSMVDACRFRDIVQTAVETGIIMKDPRVLELMVNKSVTIDTDTGKLVSKSSSISKQCYFDGEWKTCVNDWCIINDTFRLMRTYGSTKFGERRFLKVCKTLNKFDPDQSEMGGLIRSLVDCLDMSQDYLIFMSSMVHAVVKHPIEDTGGWSLSSEESSEHRATFRAVMEECLPEGQTLAMVKHKLSIGNTTQTSTALPCDNNGTLKRKRVTLDGIDGYNHSKHHDGYLEKITLDPASKEYMTIIQILSLMDDLVDVVQNTLQWRVQACVVRDLSEDKRQKHPKEPIMYWAMPNTKMCPIGGAHSKAGKTLIKISRRGKVTAQCFGGRCSGTTWTASQSVGELGLEKLWPT
jgi:hypothetical protein